MPKKRPHKRDPVSAPQADQPAAGRSSPAEATPEEAAADRLAAVVEEARQQQSDPLESLRTELNEAQDRALRMQAELENYRKRAAREMQEQRRYAQLPLMRDLLPVLDNMDRAIEAAEKTHDTADLLEGVKMVARQLAEVLERHHCVRIRALGEPFDPHLHEAILQQPSDEHPGGTVMQVTQTGFLLHDRVVRPSQVIVSGANELGEAGQEDAEEKEAS